MEALNKKTILSARDVEIQFSLRGDKLKGRARHKL